MFFMQNEKIIGKFYNNYLEDFRKKQVKGVPASFNEWFKFDFNVKSGVFAIICPICSCKRIKKGIKIDTKKTSLRDMRYIEYLCLDCGSHFLI